jgi:Mg-chelatase subunit ChlD
MRERNISVILLCFLWIALTFFVSCGEKKTKQKVKAGEEKTTQNLPDYDQIQRVEIPLDDATGEASLARNFYFIFDGSGSMGDTQGGQVKLKGAKEAVHRFLSKIPADANLGLYVFDARGTREVVPLGPNNWDAFKQSINNVKDGGTTPLAQSIRFGTDRLVQQYKKQLGYG